MKKSKSGFILLVVIFCTANNLKAQSKSKFIEEKAITLTSANFTQQINRDSVNKAETSFQLYNTRFLNSSKDSSYVRNDLADKVTYTATALIKSARVKNDN